MRGGGGWGMEPYVLCIRLKESAYLNHSSNILFVTCPFIGYQLLVKKKLHKNIVPKNVYFSKC